jgi:hypothetical protein
VLIRLRDREENQQTRERKRVGKEARESRLIQLAQLGIAMPPPASPSVLGTQAAIRARHRHSALVARSARDAPYARPPPSLSSDSPYFASDVASVLGIPPGYTSEHLVHDVQGRRRGVTLSGYEPSYAALSGYTSQPGMVLDSGTSPYASHPGQQPHFSPNSLSQPSTPEEAYMVHANMLQAGLAREQGITPPVWTAEPSVLAQQRSVTEPGPHATRVAWQDVPAMGAAAPSTTITTTAQWAADPYSQPTPPGWTLEALHAAGAEEARSAMARRRSSLDHLRRPSHVGASTAAFFHRVVGAAVASDIQPIPAAGEHVSPGQVNVNAALALSRPLPSGMGANAPDYAASGLMREASSSAMSFHDPWNASAASASPTSLAGSASSPAFSQGQQHLEPSTGSTSYLSHRGSNTSSVGVPSPLREISDSDGTSSGHPSAYVSPASSMHVPARSGSSQHGGSIGSVGPRRRSAQSSNSPLERADAGYSLPTASSPLSAPAQGMPAPAQGMPAPGDWATLRHAHGSPLLSPDTELSTGLFAMSYASASPSYASSAASSHSGIHAPHLSTPALHATIATALPLEQQQATPQPQIQDAQFSWASASEGGDQGASPSQPPYAADFSNESWY